MEPALVVKVREEETLRDGKVSRTGVIEVINESDSTLHAVVISLSNIKQTSLRESSIHIPALDARSSLRREYTFSPPSELSVSVKEVLSPPAEWATLVIPVGVKAELTLELSLKNESQVPLKVTVTRPLPTGFSVKSVSQTSGEASTDGQIVWSLTLPPAESAKLTARLECEVQSPEPIDLGTVTLVFEGERPLSGVGVTASLGAIPLVEISKDEVESGLWEVRLTLSSPVSTPCSAYGRISVTGDVESIEPEVEGLKVEGKHIVLEGVDLAAPLEICARVRSRDVPQVSLGDLKLKIPTRVEYEVRGEYEIPRGTVNTLLAELELGVETRPPEYLRGKLRENEVPSIGTSEVKLNVRVRNVGTAPIKFVEITGSLPASAVVDVSRCSITGAEGKLEVSVTPKNERGVEKTVSVRLVGVELKSGGEATVVIPLVVEDPREESLPIKMTLRAGVDERPPHVTASAEAEVFVVQVVRRLRVAHKLVPTPEPDVYDIVKELVNESDVPIPQTVVLRIPAKFKVASTEPTAEVVARGDITEVRWNITVPERQKVELRARIHATKPYTLDELLKAVTL